MFYLISILITCFFIGAAFIYLFTRKIDKKDKIRIATNSILDSALRVIFNIIGVANVSK